LSDFDGGHVRSRHRQEERHFEVIAGKVINAGGNQHPFAFARNSQTASAEAFAQALTAAGVHADTPATVLCDGDAGLWRLQHESAPATMITFCQRPHDLPQDFAHSRPSAHLDPPRSP
jgi:hypothetical protein